MSGGVPPCTLVSSRAWSRVDSGLRTMPHESTSGLRIAFRLASSTPDHWYNMLMVSPDLAPLQSTPPCATGVAPPPHAATNTAAIVASDNNETMRLFMELSSVNSVIHLGHDRGLC